MSPRNAVRKLVLFSGQADVPFRTRCLSSAPASSKAVQSASVRTKSLCCRMRAVDQDCRSFGIELGFPVYSRGSMPRGPIKKNEGNINTPIMCAGVRVNPGDLVVGDSDGVCVIPKEHIETVLFEAEKKLEYENNREKTIAAYREARRNGTELPVLAPKWVLDMLAQGGK